MPAAGGNKGAGSSHEKELKSAVKAALECAKDQRKFLNESEPVLTRFKRALDQLHRQGYSDEAAILKGIDDKEIIVHFLMDCVRNRFLLWHNVSEVKKVLITERTWDQAFSRHLRSCSTCKTVELEKPSEPPPPETRWPVPFCLEMLAVLGVALPALAIGQGCDCKPRPWLVGIGSLLCLPWLVFEALWRLRHDRLLAWFVGGDYAVGVLRHPAGLFWKPSEAHFLEPEATGDKEQPVREKGWTSFGWWYPSQLRASASIEDQGAVDDSSSSSGSDSEGGPARSLTVAPAAAGRRGAAGGSGARALRDLQVTCASHRWTDRSASLLQGGEFTSEGKAGRFDGDCLTVSLAGKQEVWVKLGWRRLDCFRKALLLLAAFGALMAGVAAGFSPGIVKHCIPKIISHGSPTDLEAYFLLDSSYSVIGSDAGGWQNEKDAAVAIIAGFEETYVNATGQPDRLHEGAAQFSTGVDEEVPLSTDIADVKARVKSMAMKFKGTTMTHLALDMCKEKLMNSGLDNAFKVCVLITDGYPTEARLTRRASREVLDAGIYIMGILVSSSVKIQSDGKDLKHLTSCSRERDSGDCKWYIELRDWGDLQGRATTIASSITESVTYSTVTAAPYVCSRPWWTLGSLASIIPLIAWLVYLHRPRPPPAPPAERKDPERLLAAGANRGRGIEAFSSSSSGSDSEGGSGRCSCVLQ
eukprot:TRINITY_DN31036_c0_g1_i1.p1 TRINITY_DN31036_c0_g1~~TRINITY_DN31036_c0_g1_i1.p1  ORF type:complete len:698 (-),score=171.00 TRINITY_DN31036_c0_g1_i1:330-2423(-)